jgi:hypothetical protein
MNDVQSDPAQSAVEHHEQSADKNTNIENTNKVAKATAPKRREDIDRMFA